MDGSLQGTCNINLGTFPVSPSSMLNADPSALAQKQHEADPGGAGTTAYFDSTASALVWDSSILTPASSPPGSASPYRPPTPLTLASPPATPQSPSDQDPDASASSGLSPASSSREFRCDFPGCKTKRVYKQKCQLR
jgi:hypothetical protein